MPERDYAGDTLEVGYSGVFDFDQLYKEMYQWFRKNGYNFRELDYKEYKEEGVQKLSVKWGAKKKLTDYVRSTIEVSLNLDGMHDVVVKNKKKMSGGLNIRINGYLEKDYEDAWTHMKLAKFLREIFDHFFLGSKMKELQGVLLKDLGMFRSTIKSFLNMQKIGK